MQSVVEGLCSISGRGACTDAERRAALWLHDELRSRGHEAWVETRWVRPQRYATLALGCLLSVAGSLLATVAPAAGLAVAAAGAVTLALQAAGWALPLFPRRATQHVLTEVPDGASEESGGPDSRIVVVIAAAYDAPRRGLVLNDRWRRRLRPRWGLAVCGVVVAGAAGARLGGVDATWLGALQLVPTVVLLVAFAAVVDIALSGFSPGANGNASGVAVALALLDELEREPLRVLRPALLLAGAGHAVPRAVASHLRAEGLHGDRVMLLELGPCGGGRPAWTTRDPQPTAAAARAAGALGLPEPRRRPRAPSPRVPAVRIACLDESGITPRAHQADDTIVDAAAMDAALAFALGVIDAIDAELAGARAASPRA